MSETTPSLSPRLLLIRIGAIGNALVAVPAIRAIRQARPKAFLALVADPLTLELLAGCPYLDEFIRYDNRGPEKAGPGYACFILGLRRRKFTHAVHFRRFLRSELIGLLSGAPIRVGFKTGSRLQFLTHYADYEEGENVIELNLRLARALGIEAKDMRLEYWPTRDSARVREILNSLPGSGPLVAIHPAGATQRERLWPDFSELARILRERLQARVVMIGAEAEREIVETTARALSLPAATALGLPLPEVGELIRRADLFAGTDSGPAHLADAAGTPGAIIYAPHRGLALQLKKWKPLGDRYLAFTPARDCVSCPEDPCPLPRQQQCAAGVPVEEVASGLEKLYAETRGKTKPE